MDSRSMLSPHFTRCCKNEAEQQNSQDVDIQHQGGSQELLSAPSDAHKLCMSTTKGHGTFQRAAFEPLSAPVGSSP